MRETRGDADRNWLAVELPNHQTSEFDDIIAELDDGPVDVWKYQPESPLDIHDQAVEAAATIDPGIKADAMIDLTGPHAVVRLNGDIYADSPADELTQAAERVLTQWANYRRREQSPAPPRPPREIGTRRRP